MVLSWFASKLNPIAIDIGTETIKLLQVEPKSGATAVDVQHRLVAAACEVIPDELRKSGAERDNFISEALKKLLTEGFRGKQVVTSLPASTTAIQHFRMGKMTGDELTKALPFETAGKLPFDSNRAVIRHTVAGEVYQNQEARQEVIVMAAPREAVERHLSMFSKLKLEVVGIHVEPTALIECFAHVFRRKSDETVSTMFVDMGAGATHVVISHGKSLVFAKHIPIGGDLLNRRVSESLKIDLLRARQTRIRISHQQVQAARLPAGVVGINADANTHPLGRQNDPHVSVNGQIGTVEAAVVEKAGAAIAHSVETLIGDLQLCARYYESIFPGRAVDRVIFVGGESRHVGMCQKIAQGLGLPATLGDPLARLMKDGTTQTTVDLRQPQPGWAIAVGLGIGLSSAVANTQTGT